MEDNGTSPEEKTLQTKHSARRGWIFTTIMLTLILGACIIWYPNLERENYVAGESAGASQGYKEGYAKGKAEQAKADSVAQADAKAKALAAAAAKPKPKPVSKPKPVQQNFKTVGLEIMKDEHGNPVPSE